MSQKTVIPYAPEGESAASGTDVVDRAGNAILEFIKLSGETTETELKEAREVAEYLTDQLRAANDQINGLEAAVIFHRARADRAEEWLRLISSEIEQGSARRLGMAAQ